MAEPLTGGIRFLPWGATERGLLVWIVLAGLVIFVAGSLADALLTRTWIRVGQRMVYNLGGDLFAHLQRRSPLFHGRTPVGDSLSRITGDSWCVYKLVDALLFSPAVAAVMMIGMVVLMVGLDPRLALLALAVAPFMAGSAFLLRGPLRAAVRARREIEARIQSHLQQTLSGVQVVQAFTQEERERQRFGQLTKDALRVQRRAVLLTNLRGLASGLIATLGTAAVLWLGARHVVDGSLSLGSLLMFLAYLGALQGHLKTFTDLYSVLQEVGIGTERVLEVLESDSEVADRPGAAHGAGLCRPVRATCLRGVLNGDAPRRGRLGRAGERWPRRPRDVSLAMAARPGAPGAPRRLRRVPPRASRGGRGALFPHYRGTLVAAGAVGLAPRIASGIAVRAWHR